MRKALSRTVTTLAVLAAIGVGGTLAAAPASAAPSCGNPGVSLSGASVSCSGSGQFRLIYQCKTTILFGVHSYNTKTGPWVKAPSSSWVPYNCNGSGTAWVEKK
jgi:hypothetical protein